MTSRQILVLGATGMLGRPVARCWLDKAHRLRILVRNIENARHMFGDKVEIVEGSALRKDNIQAAKAGCEAVHINLTQEAELTAMQHVIDLAPGSRVERVTYVSATTVRDYFDKVGELGDPTEANALLVLRRSHWMSGSVCHRIAAKGYRIELGRQVHRGQLPDPGHGPVATLRDEESTLIGIHTRN